VSSGAFAARKSVFDEYLGLAGLADEVARALGVGNELIGRVALDYDDPARVEVLIPPEWWVRNLARAPEVLDPGYYLLAVDPKTLSAVLLVVENARPRPVVRAGPQSHVNLKTHQPAAGEAVVPILVEASMASAKHLAPHIPREGKLDPGDVLAAFKSAPPRAAGAPPDPNSPVVIPPAEVVTGMLFPHEEDYYVLGALGVLDSPYRPPGGSLVEFPLPWSVARKHILVTGTTGSGKTSLVKNLLANVVYRHETLAAKAPLNVLVLDASGDFRVTVLPGSPGESETLTLYAPPGCKRLLNAIIALPLAPRTTVNYQEVMNYARGYARFLVEDEARLLAGRPECRIHRMEDLIGPCPALLVEAECSTPEGPARPRFIVAPFAVKAERGSLLSLLASIDPYLTERAKEIIKTLEDVEKSHCVLPVDKAIQEIAKGISGALTSRGGQKGSSCDNLTNNCAREICNKAKGMHQGSLGNLLSRLRIWGAVGLIVDRAAAVCPAEYARIAGHSQRLGEAVPSVVVVDLEYPARILKNKADIDQLKVALGYNMLRSFVAAAEEREGGRAFLVVDEAHLFFPRDSERNEWASVLVKELKWVARLGRSRGISLVFSTHRPSDVDRVVLTLANTKVYMRTDVKTAREAELPQGLRERLPFFRDHAGIVESYYVRGGYVTFVGGPSMLGHRLV